MANVSTAKSTVSMSIPQMIGAVVFIITTSLSIGMAWNKFTSSAEEEKNMKSDMVDLKTAVVKISTILENMQEKQKSSSEQITQISNDSHVLKTEIVVINSKIEDLKRKK